MFVGGGYIFHKLSAFNEVRFGINIYLTLDRDVPVLCTGLLILMFQYFHRWSCGGPGKSVYPEATFSYL